MGAQRSQPAHPQLVAATAPPPEPLPPDGAIAAWDRGPVVLLIEDDPKIRRVLRATLLRQRYRLVEAVTDRAGLGLGGTLLLYAVLRVQPLLHTFDPAYRPGPLAPDLAMNTAISFATTTTWQAYGGETTMSYLSQAGDPRAGARRPVRPAAEQAGDRRDAAHRHAALRHAHDRDHPRRRRAELPAGAGARPPRGATRTAVAVTSTSWRASWPSRR